MNKPNEMAVSERLDLFLKSVNMNPFSLSKKIGGTSQKYYKIIQGKSNPQYETIESILSAFPELSAEWLMRGRGEMFVNQNNHSINERERELEQKVQTLEGVLLRAMGKSEGVTDSPKLDDLIYGTCTEKHNYLHLVFPHYLSDN